MKYTIKHGKKKLQVKIIDVTIKRCDQKGDSLWKLNAMSAYTDGFERYKPFQWLDLNQPVGNCLGA